MYDLYDVEYGIYNHLVPQDPPRKFASVELHPDEDVCKISPIYGRMEEYHTAGVYEILKISFFEMMQRPRYEVEQILAFCRKQSKEMAKATAGATRDLDKMLKGG